MPVERDELLRRRNERNRRAGDANSLTFFPEALADFFARFEPPGDDEGAVVYTGDVDAVYAPAR